MNVVIPMAGRGNRFYEKGYTLPKPLIDVKGQPMISRVIENLNMNCQFIFIIQEKDEAQLLPVLKSEKPDCIIIKINGITEGAACTCLLTKDYLSDGHLIIANCDQIMDWDSNKFIETINTTDVDGYILTFESDSKNNSYVKLNRHGYITRVAEKEVISKVASTGVYHWSKSKYMVEACEKMIAGNKRCNNEFYLCPSYNEMIEDGYILKTFPVNKHYPIGTPSELETYLANS